MLRSLFNLSRGMSRSSRRCAVRGKAWSYRPTVLDLESRTLLSTFTWLRPVSGDWDDPANWAGGQVPGVPGMPGVTDTRNADVVIPFRGITVTHATGSGRFIVSLINEAALNISGGSLSLFGGNGIIGGSNPSRTDGVITVEGSGTLTVGSPSSEVGLTLGGAGSVRKFATLNVSPATILNLAVHTDLGVLSD